MQEIGLFEAETNLLRIVEQVQRTGQPVTLTNRGEPCVDLVPHHNTLGKHRPHASVLAELDSLRKNLPKSSVAQIKSDIEEGRR